MNKTASTDIEEIRKEFEKKFGELTIHHSQGKRIKVRKPNSDMEMAWDFFLPHLSNKSELRKKAVREFVDYAFKEGAGVSYAENGLEVIWQQMEVMFQALVEQFLKESEKK